MSHERTAKRTVIYRPGPAIGIGHLIYSWVGYATLARSLRADFITTVCGTVLETPRDESAFLRDCFQIAPEARARFTLGHDAIARRLAPRACPGDRMLVIGRREDPGRAVREFPVLAGADFTDRTRLHPERLGAYDLIYADSVIPPDDLAARLGGFRPLLRFNAGYRRRAAAMARAGGYLAVHLRHGNGESLGERPGGQAPGFHRFAETIAGIARTRAEQSAAETILCLSDNAETARRLADLTNGRIAGADFLPNGPFQRFLRDDKAEPGTRIDKMLLDLAVLSGAAHIVAGESLYPKAAHQLSPRAKLEIVPPPEADYLPPQASELMPISEKEFSMTQKTALVCGAGGFIGGHLVKRLKAEGFWVRGVDLKFNEHAETEADDFVIGDLREQTVVRSVVDRRFDEVYQLAADMGGAGYIFTGENDANVMHNSATINLGVLDACHKRNIKRVFYSSSACMYPEHNQLDPDNPNCAEDSAYPANPDSEYGWEKLFSERLYLAYNRNFGMECRVARYHNIFGPEGTWEGGKEKAPAAMCRKVAEAPDGGAIEVWGDGLQTRSFLYIDECIEGTTRLLRSEFEGPVNIGSEEMIAINDLARMVIAISGKDVSINNIPGPEGVRGRNSDNRLIAEKLGWAPEQPLKTGMEKTYAWISRELARKHNRRAA